ncbi:SusC/RagA family TonB-linked outer membrane protein [Flavobacteriaceae bacterium]|nr:SusC/RagA family TonB-linked outer membrane protein [Flavobacteriaceae bacterium]MDB4591093.1 SusC/RagA family TonB-linked outer membrane protein [Flavobacteriaceae bacterium]
MKLSFFLLVSAMVPISATAYSQEQMLSVKAKNVSLVELFDIIQEQSDYDFFYKAEGVDETVKVSFNGDKKAINEILDEAFKSTSLDYRIVDYDIVVLDRTKPVYQEKVVLTGKVIDESGEPLPGVNVFDASNPTNGTITTYEGTYKLTLNSTDAIVKFSFIGFNEVEVGINGRSTLDITMVSDVTELNDVVVTALGIKREQKALSYNVQKVDSEDLNKVKSTNFMNSMVGKVAGVTINSSAAGPGAATKVVMRGPKSITKSNNALYVVDGIPMFNQMSGGSGSKWSANGGSESIADINSDDIESISMLTGAAAAALYGSKAANGVVLITTKRGQEGKTKVSFNNSTTLTNVAMLPEFQNTYGNKPGNFDSWGEKLKTPTDYDPKNLFETGFDVINTLSLSSGSKRNQTYVSLSSTTSQGVVYNNEYDRYNLTFRNTAELIKDKLTADFGFNLINTNNQNGIAQGKYFNPLISAYLFPRGENFEDIRMFERWDESRGIHTQYWPFKDAVAMQNPFWETRRMMRVTKKNRYIANTSLKWVIKDWVNIAGRAKIDSDTQHAENEYSATTDPILAGPNGRYSTQISYLKNQYADVVININKTFAEDFKLMANIGSSIDDVQYYKQQDDNSLNLPNLFTTQNVELNTHVGVNQNKYHDQTQSVFANIEVGYKSIAYLTLTGRNDWDSKLAFSDQSSFFYPSVGLSVVASEVLDLPEFVSFAKVRGSYTEVASPFGRYLSNPALAASEGGYKSKGSMPAIKLKPEKTKSIEFGLNIKLWKAVNIDATYYKSNTYNQTFRVQVPASSGYANAYVQAGDIQNEGLELAIGFNKELNQNLSVSTNLTYTYNDNVVKKLANGAMNPYTKEEIDMEELQMGQLGGGNAPKVILREGGSMGDIYVEKRIRRDAGLVFVDSQGKIQTEKYDEARYLGSVLANSNVGWANNITYKNVDLGFVFSGRFGGLVTSNTEAILDYYGVSQRSADDRDAGGIPMNGGILNAEDYYKVITSGDGGLGQKYTYDATNIRLSQVSLSYALPKSWFNEKLNVRLGIVGKNLLMIYCKAPFDPELSAAASSTFYQGVDYFMMPSTRSFGGNIKIEF